MDKKFVAKLKAPLEEPELLEVGEFTAYASTFDDEPDSYGDIVRPGAFAATLREWEQQPRAVLPVLWGHRLDDPDYNLGEVLEAREDEHGLWIRARLDLSNPKAAQAYKLIKGGRLTQLSFAFDILEQSYEERDGEPVRVLEAVKLYEVSLVPIGANQHTEVLAVKEAASYASLRAKIRPYDEPARDILASARDDLLDALASVESVLTGSEDDKPMPAHPLEGEPSPPPPPAPDPLAVRLQLAISL